MLPVTHADRRRLRSLHRDDAARRPRRSERSRPGGSWSGCPPTTCSRLASGVGSRGLPLSWERMAERLLARGAGRYCDAECAPKGVHCRAGSRKNRPSAVPAEPARRKRRAARSRTTAAPPGASTPGDAPMGTVMSPGSVVAQEAPVHRAAAQPHQTRGPVQRVPDEPEPDPTSPERSQPPGELAAIPTRSRASLGEQAHSKGARPRSWARIPNSRPPCRTPADSSTL